jgi:Na+-transporting NADH:ubiquinone oxidoreductase subunit NqrC
MIRIYILIVVIGLVSGVIYGAYFYYNDTQNRIRILTENSAQLEIAAQTQKHTIDTLVQDAEKMQNLQKN